MNVGQLSGFVQVDALVAGSQFATVRGLCYVVCDAGNQWVQDCGEEVHTRTVKVDPVNVFKRDDEEI